MVHISYTNEDPKRFREGAFINKLTMEDGIDNPAWDEIAELTEICEALAGELRTKLEELSSAMFPHNICYLTSKDGDPNGIDSYTIDDFAASVSEIEEELSMID